MKLLFEAVAFGSFNFVHFVKILCTGNLEYDDDGGGEIEDNLCPHYAIAEIRVITLLEERNLKTKYCCDNCKSNTLPSNVKTLIKAPLSSSQIREQY